MQPKSKQTLFLGQTVDLSLSSTTDPIYVYEFTRDTVNCTLETDLPLENYVFTWTDYDFVPISFNESSVDYQGVYPRKFDNKTTIFLKATGEGKTQSIANKLILFLL